MKLEIHSIVELNNNSINRGENGSLKKTTDAFGNIYQYISRQCIARNVRELKMQDPDNFQGIKVIRPEMEAMIRNELAKAGLSDQSKVENVVKEILKYYGLISEKKGQDNKSGNKSKSKSGDKSADAEEQNAEEKELKNIDNLPVFLSAREIEFVIKELSKDDWKDIPKAIENVQKKLPMSLDVAMDGRMVASAPNLNVRGAASGSDLIALTKMNTVYDFYSSNGSINGATNLGVIEESSSLFYGFTCIDIDVAKDNLKDLSALKKAISWPYLKDYVECVGNGRQHGKFSRSYPLYIAIVLTDGNCTRVRHSAMTNKNGVSETVQALHEQLENRMSNPNRVSDHAKMMEWSDLDDRCQNDLGKFIEENAEF